MTALRVPRVSSYGASGSVQVGKARALILGLNGGADPSRFRVLSAERSALKVWE